MFHILFGTFVSKFGFIFVSVFRFISAQGFPRFRFLFSSFPLGTPGPLRPPWPLRSALNPTDFRWFCKSQDALFVLFLLCFCFIFIFFAHEKSKNMCQPYHAWINMWILCVYVYNGGMVYTYSVCLYNKSLCLCMSYAHHCTIVPSRSTLHC